MYKTYPASTKPPIAGFGEDTALPPKGGCNEKKPKERLPCSRVHYQFRVMNEKHIMKQDALKIASIAIAYIQLAFQILLLVLLPMVHVHDRVFGAKLARSIRIEEIVKISIQYALMILTTIFTITLIVGLHKNRPGFVKAFLMYAGIVFFLSMLMCFGVFLYLTRVDEFDVAYRYLVSKIFFFLFHFYCLLIIRSHWFNMVARREQQLFEGLKYETA